MKKVIIVLGLVFILAGCGSKEISPVSAEFFADLASENNRIAGRLSRKVFNRNLAPLTYEYYYQYLKENLAPSAQGLPETIARADRYLFRAKPHAFMILLYFEASQTLVCDISNTAFADWVVTGDGSTPLPSLEAVAAQRGF